MKSVVFVIGLLLTSTSLFAQTTGDTIVVQAFDWSMTALGNSGARDMIVSFPDTTLTYEKIIMQYNMRCRDGNVNTTGGNYVACGEWDYSCNTYVHDSTRIDSLISTAPDYIISGFSGTTYNYTTQPTYTFLQQDLTTVTLNNILSENQYTVLNGTTPTSSATNGSDYSGRSFYVYTAAELIGSGITAGDIDGFLVNAIGGGSLNFMRVKMKQVMGASLDNTNPDLTGFTEVFSDNYTFSAGQNRIQFYTPFVWDGISDVIIELSFTNSTPTTTINLEGTSSAPGMGMYAANGIHTNVAENGHIEFPTAGMSTTQNEVSVSFWAFGDANTLPVNTTIMYGQGADGGRDISSHLPWGNGSVYFDCGDLGSGFDRINKAAAVNEFEGQWRHWTFTKNAATGIMNIYLDGVLWHSGTGKTNPIEFAQMIVGKDLNYNNNYKGLIDEVTVWNVELQPTEIANWMNISLDNTHPNWGNLVAYYKLDDYGMTTVLDDSPASASGTTSSQYIWKYTRGKDLSRFFEVATERPSITLFEGNYDTTITVVTVLDSLVNVPNTVEEYTIIPNPGTVYDDDVNLVSTNYYWEAVDQNIYDEFGNLVGTIPVTSTGSIIISDMNYYRRWPMKFEVTSFVTPYGLYLNLGPNGKTWEFDLTDFAPVFKGDMRFTMERGGQWNEDYDIKFLFIVGTPPRDVMDIQQIWRNNKIGYQAIMADTYFAPRDITLNPMGDAFKIRSMITGHGQEGEFIPRTHYVDIDGGADEFSWQVWKECAENPIFPQGGTWIYDRAGWCPGRPTDLEEWDLNPYVTAGQTHSFDYGVTTASGASNYIVNHQLVTYDAPNFTLDATIKEIKNPSNYVEYMRENAICVNPKVVIQNTGSATLTSATIEYWVNDQNNSQTFNWTGSLDFLGEEEVELPTPAPFWTTVVAGGPNVFHARVLDPNGGSDEYAYNDEHSANFEIPDVVPNYFYIQLKTNSAGAETSYDLRDDLGNVIFSKGGLANNTLYRDTFQLAPGCYQLNVYDTDDDGIDFWANSDGIGQMYIREIGVPVIVKTFEGDFGKSIVYNFTVDFPLSYEDIKATESVELYPNPTRDQLNLAGEGIDKATISVYNEFGEVCELPESSLTDEVTFNTSSLKSGLYTVRININGRIISKRFVIAR